MSDGFPRYSPRRVSSRSSLLDLKHLVPSMVQVEQIMDLRAHRLVFEALHPLAYSSSRRRQPPVLLRLKYSVLPSPHLSSPPRQLISLPISHLSLVRPLLLYSMVPQSSCFPLPSSRPAPAPQPPPPASLLSSHSLHPLPLLHLLHHRSFHLTIRWFSLSAAYWHMMKSFRLRCPTMKRWWRGRREVQWPMMAALCLPPSRC